jgi:hypothetical protein
MKFSLGASYKKIRFASSVVPRPEPGNARRPAPAGLPAACRRMIRNDCLIVNVPRKGSGGMKSFLEEIVSSGHEVRATNQVCDVRESETTKGRGEAQERERGGKK